jgi:Ca2+-binding RTX toxin-like protein
MTRLTPALAAVLMSGSLLVAPPAHAQDGPVTAECGGIPATMVGTTGDDELRGTAEVDIIVGLAGDDTISGLGESDVLCGGAGDDVLLGGSGDDQLLGGMGASVLSGGTGIDRMSGVLALDAALGTQSVSGGGSRLDKWFVQFVTRGSSTIDGTTGRVNLRRDLARSADEIGSAAMPVRGIEQVELLTRGRWTLIGSGLDERLLGHRRPGAPVVIHAGGGRDVLRGTRNDDLLDGGRGVDTVEVTPGDDTCRNLERFLNALSC